MQKEDVEDLTKKIEEYQDVPVGTVVKRTYRRTDNLVTVSQAKILLFMQVTKISTLYKY